MSNIKALVLILIHDLIILHKVYFYNIIRYFVIYNIISISWRDMIFHLIAHILKKIAQLISNFNRFLNTKRLEITILFCGYLIT